MAEKYNIEMRATGSIRPYDNNPRLNDDAVKAVATSLKEFGFRQPIVVDEEGVIVVGHTRLKAAIKQGLSTVPVHVAKGLTPSQVKAYRIADNQTATLADWDDSLLSAEIAGLEDVDFDLSTLGFSDYALDRILQAGEENSSQDVVITEIYQVAVTCENEQTQRELYERLSKEGLQCQVLTM